MPFTPQDKLKLQIQNVRNQAPRFLYRSWSADSGGRHEGLVLNSAKAIVPLAFARDPELQTTPLYQKPNLYQLIHHHIEWEGGPGFDFATVFTSWSTSLEIPLWYISNRHRHPSETFVTVIDTTLLTPQCEFYWVTDLHKIGLANREKDWEWLAYGPITGGPGMWCISMSELLRVSPDSELSLGIPDFGFRPALSLGKNWHQVALREPVRKAVEKGCYFAKLFLRCGDHIPEADRTMFYVLVLTWLVAQGPATTWPANGRSAPAIVFAIYLRARVDVPKNLRQNFVRRYDEVTSGYERTLDLVQAIHRCRSDYSFGSWEELFTGQRVLGLESLIKERLGKPM